MSRTLARKKRKKFKSKQRKQSKNLTAAKLLDAGEPLKGAIADAQLPYIQELLQEWETAS